MEHKHYQEQIPFYVAQTLADGQRQAFERHLATCVTCQQEINEWRGIAAAVWANADDVARQLPPLSPEVYNRLQYRDRAPTNRHAANPPRPAYARQPLPPRRRKRSNQFPLTMAAAFIVAVLFGGLLLILAIGSYNPNQQTGDEIALGATVTGTSVGDVGSFATIPPTTDAPIFVASNTPIPAVTQVVSVFSPSSTPFVQPSIVPPSSTPFIPPRVTEEPVGIGGGGMGGGIGSGGDNNNAASTFSMPQGSSGPFVTLTPGLMEDGYHLCYLFNPTNNALPVYAEADWVAEIVGQVLQGEEFRTLIRSDNGWYEIFLRRGNATIATSAWMPPDTAYLRGNCYESLFWVPTPTVGTNLIPTPVTGFEGSAVQQMAEITSPYADLYNEPSFSSSIAVAGAGERFTVLGYVTISADRFVQIRYHDGRSMWVWLNNVSITDVE